MATPTLQSFSRTGLTVHCLALLELTSNNPDYFYARGISGVSDAGTLVDGSLTVVSNLVIAGARKISTFFYLYELGTSSFSSFFRDNPTAEIYVQTDSASSTKVSLRSIVHSGDSTLWSFRTNANANALSALGNGDRWLLAIASPVEGPPPPNVAPTADAGETQSAVTGERVALDGSGSADSDGTIAAYSWTKTAGPAVTISASNTATPTFVAPTQATGYQLTFRLTVTDDGGLTDTDDVVVNVAVNRPPTADAGPAQSVVTGATVQLDGTSSADIDGTVASHAWTQVSGRTVTLSDPSIVNPTFVAPTQSTNYHLTFRLTVTDNAGLSNTDDVIIGVVVNLAPLLMLEQPRT